MKRFTLSVVVTAVLGLAAYNLAGAQAPGAGPGVGGPAFQERGRAPGPGGPRGFGRGSMGLLRGIELTDDQQAQIKAIHDAERQERQGPPPEAALHRQLQAELFADTPDAAKIAGLQEQLAQAHTAMLAKQVEIEQKIAQILTAEQRAAIRERLSLAPEGRERVVRRRLAPEPRNEKASD